MPNFVEINNAEGHDPPWPFMVVDRRGFHVDLSKIDGQLFDAPTVARITWGHHDPSDGRLFGIVQLKNGQGRKFWEANLLEPYLKAYQLRATELDAQIEQAKAKAVADAAAEAARQQALIPTGTHDAGTEAETLIGA